ncbi:hypothetical protein LPJ53_003389 [Coemansia erecta]|uniref:Uncharacterized protein n=1 Tax=Coemansia erecta TaxID=147472 RepID=A0A9W7Y193_9FUNG|nr:hypothetical protein LPJ53_003389 [Coemansia erecta]
MGPKTVEIVATFNQVASGMFAEKLKEQFPLRNTKKMTLSIESGESLEHGSDQDTTIGAISNEHIRKLAVGFALSLIRTFPNIQTLCFHSSPDSSPIHCMYSTYAYSLLAGYANAHPHCSLKTFIGYHIYGNMLSTPDIPVIHGGLTHLSLGKIVWNEDGIIEAAHRNASTLKMLSVTYARTTQVLGLVVDAEGQQVVYPELVKLTLGVCNGVPMEIREICPFNPFPKLQHLSIPGAFPFANGNMLNSKKLKTLVLAVSNHSLKTLKHTAVFSGRRKLQYVDIRTLPVEDPALFPMVESSESNVLSEANSVLCQEFVLNTVSSEPFSKARLNLGSSLDASGFISRLPDGCNISELDLGLISEMVDDRGIPVRGMRHKTAIVALAWLPQEASGHCHSLYRQVLPEFARQLRHCDFIFEVQDWKEFTKESIVARILAKDTIIYCLPEWL